MGANLVQMRAETQARLKAMPNAAEIMEINANSSTVGVGYFRPVNIPPKGTYYYMHTDLTDQNGRLPRNRSATVFSPQMGANERK